MLAVVVTTNATSPKACVTVRTLFPMWHLPVQKGRLGRWIQPFRLTDADSKFVMLFIEQLQVGTL